MILYDKFINMNQQKDIKLQSNESLNNNSNEAYISKYFNISLPQIKDRQVFIDAPRQIPKKSYSLAPDMATGWKPKKPQRINYQNVFPLNFSTQIVDEIVKNLTRKPSKYYQLVYLGPRKGNSYQLHENRQYENPYQVDKKIQSLIPERPGINKNAKLQPSNLTFSSDFESGNLDVAIKINENEYDLFMRVDTNTRGHTNWYYFCVKNGPWVGSVKFNFCNFRRDRSLYQRGMKPFVKSLKQGNEWIQKGYNIQYERKSLRYKFLYDEEDDSIIQSLSTYYTMTFTYNFDSTDDTVYFAYCIPYTYTDLLSMIREVYVTSKIKYETGWRSLSGLPIPLLQITDFQQPSHNKKIVLVTARIHPGESNSSYVCEGLIKSLCLEEEKKSQILKKFHFYIVPMLNPDGVVAGNYRTSLFGKDLNRTFHQQRKYAFPESFSLIQFAKLLKKEHKQRFTIYIDLHGHSVKKNVFFYGPDYNIAHSYYAKSRQLGKILGNLTSMFRYYSCAFRISIEKATTARATFNRSINIPFTYTVESSNGAFYDSVNHSEKPFTSKNWMEMGIQIVRGLNIWVQNQKSTNRLSRSMSFIEDQQEQSPYNQIIFKQPPGKQRTSDDQISEGKSDSEPENQDMDPQQLLKIEKQIEGKTAETVESPIKFKKRQMSPNKSERVRNQRVQFDWSNNLRQSYNPNKRSQSFKAKKQRLPPINLQLNPIQFLGNMSQKKRITIAQALSNMTSADINPNISQKRQRLSISQMMMSPKQLTGEQTELVLKKKMSRQDLAQKFKKRR